MVGPPTGTEESVGRRGFDTAARVQYFSHLTVTTFLRLRLLLSNTKKFLFFQVSQEYNYLECMVSQGIASWDQSGTGQLLKIQGRKERWKRKHERDRYFITLTDHVLCNFLSTLKCETQCSTEVHLQGVFPQVNKRLVEINNLHQ